MARFKAAILGGSGYGGGEMIRRLLTHPEVELVRVTSVDRVGEPVSAVHLSLEGLTDLKFQRLTWEEAVRGVDVALLALPHQASLDAVQVLARKDSLRIVDMSAAYRLNSAAAYRERYGVDHPAPELLARFVYGLPELYRPAIGQAQWVANPGCFATCVQLALAPWADLRPDDPQVSCVAMTGSSGSGVEPRATTHHPTRSVNLKAYAPLRHVQAPEMEENLRARGVPDLDLAFVPVSAPLARGILAVCTTTVAASDSQADWEERLQEAYRSEPLVRMVRRPVEVAAVATGPYAEVGVEVGETAVRGRRRACFFGALDNLIKGGAGQAIQNMNLLLGLDERASLRDPGSYP